MQKPSQEDAPDYGELTASLEREKKQLIIENKKQKRELEIQTL